MNPQQEQQIINSFLVGFTQDLDHTLLDILFKLIINESKDQDDIIIRCLERYLLTCESYLDHLSKEQIGFGLKCRTLLQKFVYSQLTDEEMKKNFLITYKLDIEQDKIIQ